ncbi:P-loop NTPase fold protein [Pseudarthrobacter sulfonivorans]|uniref:P-loop NTPase fold protein n=1 Tax=Pseudarthrobacter sulfonivorans TaxID=121292 RepID=UPI0027D90F8B|nr:P-loop NTPase fold protein [Pseudarthrobacter sulfonivorans]
MFLIDDLDRCEPEYIVDFLGVIQTLVRDARQTVPGPASKAPPPGPYAFVAADGYWIRTSYEAHYNSARPAEVPGRPLGYQFLEKIFQLQVRLPSISDATKQAFYESLLKLQPNSDSSPESQGNLKEAVLSQVRQATTGEDISKAAAGANQLTDAALRLEVLGTAAVRFSESDIQESTRHALAPYGRFLEPNPRSIKLFVNTYNVLRSLRILEGLTSIPIRSLALWAVLEIRWPLLADHLRAHPDDIRLTESTTPATRQPIRDLLESEEVQGVIADPEQGPLTPSDVRDCTGRALSRP